MTELGGDKGRKAVVFGTVLGGLVAALASFVGSAQADLPSGGSAEFDAGQAVGYGLGYGLIICAITYFVALRRGKGAQKWGALGLVLLCAIVGASVGASL
ncbi:MAG: hypothetical protein AAF687_04325 [Pseudomonadota bacterium]